MNFLKKPIILSLLSALLLFLPWFGLGSFFVLGAFVPLFYLQNELHRTGRKGFLWWVALTLTLWILASCFWVSFAFWGAAIAVPVVGVVSLWPAWWLYHLVWKRASKALAYTILVCAWIACEAYYTMGDVSFPWLTLGGAFADTPILVQWYSITGMYGGSLWILLVNIMLYTAISKRRYALLPIVAVVLPVAVSLTLYYTYHEPQETIQIAAIQPNIDPYGEKYQTDGLGVVLDLARSAPRSTELYLAPETVITGAVDLDEKSSHPSVMRIQQFLKEQGTGAAFIIGSMTTQSGRYYNSALYIDTLGVQVYHKSKLVIGVEVVPGWAAAVAGAIDLGGYVGSLDRQPQPTLLADTYGSAICYESIYGEYFAQWVASGAKIMTVITNDGWWGDTRGYVNHFHYARLRAVECRRSIARSANTGISGLITPRGDIVSRLDWDKRGVVSGSLPLNEEMTPYVRWGDMTVRLSFYVGALALLYFVGNFFRRKI